MELLLVELVLVVVMELDVLEEVWATTLFGPFSKMISSFQVHLGIPEAAR